MAVSVRELKTHLSEYLRRVRRGESVEVTSHGEVIARLVPPPAVAESPVDILRRQPWIAAGKSGAAFGLETPAAWRDDGPSLTELLLEDRE